MWTLAVVLSVVSTVVESQTSDYSNLCANHTMVIYPTPSLSLCATTYLSGVSEADKILILKDHNNYRSRLAQGLETRGLPGPQLPAADMKKLVWDDELAIVAQRWSDQCNYGHDQCRKVDRFYVGQNVYRLLSSVKSTTVNWTRPTSKWYDEVISFNPADISPFVFNKLASHFTAQMWANTEYIGCGFKSYKSTLSTEASTPYIRYFVCNYGQGGNYIGETMYKVGTACSMCPAGKVCENSLCA